MNYGALRSSGGKKTEGKNGLRKKPHKSAYVLQHDVFSEQGIFPLYIYSFRQVACPRNHVCLMLIRIAIKG